MKRPFIHLACIFLLLFAQHASLAHSIWHARDSGCHDETIEREAGCAAERAPEQNPAQLCEFDIAFSQVLGCLSAPAHALALDESRTHAFAFHLELFHTARLLVPLSRGPPTLL